jgi:hypothetical protein
MPGVEEAFTAPSAGTVPAVLSGPMVGGTGPGASGFGGSGSGSGIGRGGFGGGGFSEPEVPALRAGGAEGGGSEAVSRRRPRRLGPGEPGTEWLGVEDALDGVSEPVLDAPAETPVAEDVPVGLRGSGIGFEATRTPARRRTDDQEPAIVVDEEAWTVPTPGGGVLGGLTAAADDGEPGSTLRAAQA